MSVRIGHASIGSDGTTKDKKDGDQNGKEIYIRSYYVHKNGWSYVLRPSADIAENVALACEKGCKNPAIGYSQERRNGLHTEAQRVGYDLNKITTPCACDCSSFVCICAIAAGVKSLEYTSNAPTTRTMESAFLRTGKFTVLKESKYLTSDKYLRRGDVIVSVGHHTVIVLDNGEKVKKKSVKEVVDDILKGLYGNGDERKARLKAEGYTNEEVKAIQAEINIRKSAQHIDQKGIDFLKQFEGCHLTAYQLKGETGYSIGFGHHGADVLPNMTISQQRAEELFKIDLQQFERYVKSYVNGKILLTQNRLNALVSYCYNRGCKGMRQLAKNSNTAQEFADNIVKYWGSNKQHETALKKRRKAERELFLS